jgi:hypothetical protein
MAKMPVEVVAIGSVPTIDIEQAISIANSVQNEFSFGTLSSDDAQVFKLLVYQKATAQDFLNSIEARRFQIRGFHPFVIAVVDTELEGKNYGNLFGSHRAEKGLALCTIANVESIIIPQGRMAAYFLYYFARYTLSFIAPSHKNHEESKDCIFDRKVNKMDVIKSMKARAICDECRNALLTGENSLTPAQFEALDALFEISGKILEGNPPASLMLRGSSPIITPDNSSVIKILFLAANPKDSQPLRLDAEVRAIDQSLQRAEFRNRFDLRQHWAVQVMDIQEHLLRHKPDIVHFSGHGSRASEIILEDVSGSSRPVPTRALGQLFSVLKDNIKCVVLNACYSEQQAKAIAQSIDCVVGMSKAIGDESAICFAASFYQALGYGRDVRTAFDLGCVQINLEGLNEQDTPKLLANTMNPKTIVFAKSG